MTQLPLDFDPDRERCPGALGWRIEQVRQILERAA